MPDRFSRHYSDRLGTLTGEQLQAALDRADLGRLESAEPAVGGLFGQNVLLTTDRGGFVLRGHPLVDWQFPRERAVARVLHEETDVPVPWPYEIEDDLELFGWPYVLMPRLPGRPVVDVDVDGDAADERIAVASAMGAMLPRVHAATRAETADYDLATDAWVPDGRTPRERAWAEVDEWAQACRRVSEAVMTDDDLAWIRAVFEANAGAYDEPVEPTLVHRDFKPSNVVVREVDGSLEVTGVFDLMGGAFSDPEEDLARPLTTLLQSNPRAARRFVAAYAAVRPLRPGHRERLRVNVLVDLLILWEYAKRNEVWFGPEVELRGLADGLLAFDPFR